uniref:Ig-like domain-containing protein n=1 Tax=Equus asinus TaxID=9793 RepID=A0A8C4PG30_EQUAS
MLQATQTCPPVTETTFHLDFFLFSLRGTVSLDPSHVPLISLCQSPQERVSISCRATESLLYVDVKHCLAWCQHRPGQPPKALIYNASTPINSVLTRFSGSGSGTDFILIISSLEGKDNYMLLSVRLSPLGSGLAHKQCTQVENFPPSAFIFPPSSEELNLGNASVMCLVYGFYPSGVTINWKVDSLPITSSIQSSLTEQDSKDNTYSLSSTLTLTKADYEAHNIYACEVSHKTLSSPLVKSFKRQDC